MKTKSLFLLGCILLLCVPALAWTPSGAGWQSTEKGPNHRKWTRVALATNQAGAPVLKTNTVVELMTGMHRRVDNEWVETAPRFVPTTNGAVGLGAAHQVSLAQNINT